MVIWWPISTRGLESKVIKLSWPRLWRICGLIGTIVLSACVPAIEQAEPAIVLDPMTGGPGTPVVVIGSGFPAKIPVSVRLGPPSVGATPQSYGDTTTDAEGIFTLSFTMPAQWPDGAPITQSEMVVVALNEDGSIKATAPFDYTPSLSGTVTLASPTTDVHQQVILAWHRENRPAGLCSDVAIYESGYVEITSCPKVAPPERRQLSDEAVDQVHAWTEAYQSFQLEKTKGTGENRTLTRLDFVGNGPREVSEIEIRMIQTLLETLLPLQ